MDSIEEVKFRAGEYLFHENDESFHFFIVQSGQIEVYRTGREGKKIPLAVIQQGQSIGEFAMIDRKPRSATARALTDVVAARITAENYANLLCELPDWTQAVLQGLVDRLRSTNDILRRYGIIDEKILLQIDAIEFDPDAPTRVEDLANIKD